MRLSYLAVDGSGREARGELEAEDAALGAVALRRRGLFPVEVTPGGAPRARPLGLELLGPRTADRVLFLSQMALMLRTGLTLLDALAALAEQARKRSLREVARRLGERVQAGTSLSRALEQERAFPPLVAHLVRTAESTGELDRAFAEAADWLDRRAALRQQVLASLAYPLVVILATCGVFFFLTTSVIPKLARFLAGRRVGLPATTQVLLDVSVFLQAWGPHLLGALVLVPAALLLWRWTALGRLVTDRAALALPVVGTVLETAGMLHIARTLGLLLESGLPLLEALRVLAGTCERRPHALGLEAVAARVIQGSGLSASLAEERFPALLVQVVSVGEKTGALDEVLAELSLHYQQGLQRLLRTLAAAIEPALLLFVGALVGFVYLSFFQAMFQFAAR